MIKKIKHFCYAESNDNELYLFSRALSGISQSHTLKAVHSCTLLLAYLNDNTQPLPDMIFLNYKMPGSSTRECLLEIKSNERLANIPVVMYSPSGHGPKFQNSHGTGVFKYMLKSNGFDETRTSLQRVISEYENGLS